MLNPSPDTATIIDLCRRFNFLRLLPALTAVVVALALLGARGPTAFWRHSEIGVGRLAKFSGSKTEFHDLMNTSRREILWDTDGVESSVALSTRNNLNFIVNGKCDGGLKLDASITHRGRVWLFPADPFTAAPDYIAEVPLLHNKTGVDALIDAVHTLPMMSPRRIVIILEAEKLLMPSYRLET